MDVEGYLWCANGSNKEDNVKAQFTDYKITNETDGTTDRAGTYRLQFKKTKSIAFTAAQARRWGSNVRCVKFTEVDAE